MFSEVHLKKMQEGLELFNQQKYWECHESLEDVWIEDTTDPGRYVYWAVIQVAAAMIHYRDKNLVGANGLIKKAKEKFSKVQELGLENDLLEKKLQWSHLKQLTLSIPEKASLEEFSELFEFRFKGFAYA